MNKKSANQSAPATGLKLLALLAAGAASGGCGLFTLTMPAITPELPAVSLESETSSDAPATDAGQQNQM